MSENHAPLTLIAKGEEFELLSSDDEKTFLLQFKADQMAAHLKDEDAARFRLDYEAIKQQFPTWEPDQMLAQLWDQGGYSWLAAQEGG